jgi:hypothetical protein
LQVVLSAAAVLVVLLAAVVSWLLPKAIVLALGWKIALSVLLIFPAGFLMGMPFPVGLARLETWHSPSVRWAWSLNAAASVLGSVAALVFAIYFGLLQTLFVGAALYGIAFLIVARSPATVKESTLHLS